MAPQVAVRLGLEAVGLELILAVAVLELLILAVVVAELGVLYRGLVGQAW